MRHARYVEVGQYRFVLHVFIVRRAKALSPAGRAIGGLDEVCPASVCTRCIFFFSELQASGDRLSSLLSFRVLGTGWERGGNG